MYLICGYPWQLWSHYAFLKITLQLFWKILIWVPSGEKYCRSSWSCAPAERDRMLMAAASVIAPPNPLIFWYFWYGTIVNLRPEETHKQKRCSAPAPTAQTSQWKSKSLTCPSAVHLNLTLTCLQSAARHAGQVGGEVAQRRQSDRANTVTVGWVTLTHNWVMAEVSGDTFSTSWKEGKSDKHDVFLWDSCCQHSAQKCYDLLYMQAANKNRSICTTATKTKCFLVYICSRAV